MSLINFKVVINTRIWYLEKRSKTNIEVLVVGMEPTAGYHVPILNLKMFIFNLTVFEVIENCV